MLSKQNIVSDTEKIMAVDKDKNVLNSCASGSNSINGNVRVLSAAEGWDKNIKRKRSVGSMSTRAVGDVETSKALVRLHACKPHARSCNELSFMSVDFSVNRHAKKLSGSCQAVANACDISRPVSDTFLSTDQHRHNSTSDNEQNTANGTEKAYMHEVPLSGNQSHLNEGRASMPPRTVPNSLPFISPDVPRTSGGLDGWTSFQYINKTLSVGSPNNRKRPLSLQPPSSAITQWGDQRQPKSSRVRKSNAMISVSGNGGSQALVEEFSYPDSGAKLACSVPSGVLSSKDVLDNSQLRPIVDNSSSMLSEHVDSITTENKSKDKGTQNCEGIGLSIRKNDNLTEVSDSVRRHGRCTRGSTQSLSCLPLKEKSGIIDSSHMTKPTRNGRSGSIRSERRKVGDPSAQRTKDGACCDDHDEILAAAVYAHYLSNVHTSQFSIDHSSDSFWEKMKPFFAFVSSDKIAYLQELIKLAADVSASFGINMHKKEGFSQKDLATDVSNGQRKDDQPNVDDHVNPSVNMDSKKMEANGSFDTISLSQRLLAAIIPEQETGPYHYGNDNNFCSHASRDHSNKTNSLTGFVDKGSNKRLSLEYETYSPLQLQDCSQSTDAHPLTDADLPGLPPDETYECMSLDDKILLELQSIGIYLENVQVFDDDEIGSNISELTSKLYQQMGKSKELLCSLDKALQSAKVQEERNLEWLAMNILIQMAYGKLMGGRSGFGSTSKGGGSKFSKQAALAFAKRVLAKCHRFEDTGKSCFTEPPYRDALYHVPVSSESVLHGAGDSQPESCLQSLACTSKQSFHTSEAKSSRGRKRELLLGEIVGTASSGAVSVLGNSLPVPTKGKRSGRDRDQNKDVSWRNITKSGKAKGERRAKRKPKQTIARPTSSGNGANKSTGGQVSLPVAETQRRGLGENRSGVPHPDNLASRIISNRKESLDFSDLPLHISDELGNQAHDISTWLNVDEDSLLDTELMGLDIPMDDLSELDMNF